MSHEALPIDVPAFIRAIQDLPVDALHSRAAEIQNSIAHLKSSNDQMVPFADDGDQGPCNHPCFLYTLLTLLCRLQGCHV